MEDRTHGRDSHFPEPEFGSSTGDQRENNPSLPGFTADDDLVFRSYFQHSNRFADRSYEEFRAAYQLGYDAARDPALAPRDFDAVEKDLEGRWLNVRFTDDEWQSVREFVREGFRHGRIGFVAADTLQGGTESRPSFADPLAEDLDPTSPESPENRPRQD